MFQHLALIKKGLRRDKRGCICFKKAFQHLALIKKGLRRRPCSTWEHLEVFQHLALIKKGLRRNPKVIIFNPPTVSAPCPD